MLLTGFPSARARGALAGATLAALLPALVALPHGAARAQDYFIPNQPRAASPARPARRAPAVPRVAAPAPEVPPPPAPVNGTATAAQTPQQLALPPAPVLPTLPKAATPPPAVIGVFDVPEVMHASTAAQQVEKSIGERREKLNEDVQKEQDAWRTLQQSLLNDRARLTADQIRDRERQLQDRITNSQRVFRTRAQVLQDASQYALAQIERTMQAVLEQVAANHGMNLVLHRQQTALNFNAFDITPDVEQQMNKVLPNVLIPPDGVEPPTLPPASPSAGPAAAAGTPAGTAAATAPKAP
jgi:Skp family chaperone for outer membrane proteins